MPSARTHCPDCNSEDILNLRNVLTSASYDYFRCQVCSCWWMLPTDADVPATRVILGNRKTSTSVATTGVCPKCGCQANLLDMSLFARVNYYRCARCSHVYAADPHESAPIDEAMRDGNKAL